MVRKSLAAALAGALILAVSPAFAAQMVDVPVIGMIDMDPMNMMAPAAPAAAPMKKMHHRKMMHHKMMHKKMMKKKM